MLSKSLNKTIDKNKYNKENDLEYQHLKSIVTNQVKSDLLIKNPDLKPADFENIILNSNCLFIMNLNDSYVQIISEITPQID